MSNVVQIQNFSPSPVTVELDSFAFVLPVGAETKNECTTLTINSTSFTPTMQTDYIVGTTDILAVPVNSPKDYYFFGVLSALPFFGLSLYLRVLRMVHRSPLE
jgi:hypothetical protein